MSNSDDTTEDDDIDRRGPLEPIMNMREFAIFCSIGILFAVSYHPTPKQFIQSLIYGANEDKSPQYKLITSEELKLYNGVNKPQLYLAIMGKVYDVTKGSDHYGPEKAYNFFVGRDASRSFITGQFEDYEGSDQVADLTPEELLSLNHWAKFYEKEYSIVGKLIGRYYKKDGKLTQYGTEVRKLIKAAEKSQSDRDEEKLKYPPCNVEWDAEKGTRVWCTNKSGGIERDWTGVPRQLYEPGSQDFRCACIKPDHQHSANLKHYEGCDSESNSCFIKT